MATEKSKGKRLLDFDDHAENPLEMEKKPRFPKGKKVKKEDVPLATAAAAGPHLKDEDDAVSCMDAVVDPRLAAKMRAKRRYQMREDDLLLSNQEGDATAEIIYDENTTFEDDGIELEPFNLKQEREEGYFDASGNYVEYVPQNEIKDAWLDSVEVDSTLADKIQVKTATEDDYKELTSEDIGKIKRSIADVLQPGETIIQALKRLKGISGDKKGKMSEGTKRTFDQLTEDAMRLLENGEYNVYHEEHEMFKQEAEGYEKIALARKGIFATAVNLPTKASSSIWDKPLNEPEANTSLQVSSADDEDQFDMFGDDEDNTNSNQQLTGNDSASGSLSEQILQSEEAGNGTESDYVYDESSGYYYSSNLGYYYDPTSKLYCSATSGIWYSFDEQTGQYAEYQITDAATAQN